MEWPTCPQPLLERLEVLRYVCRDKKHRSMWDNGPFKETDKDFQRIIKMKGLGKELAPNSYKRLSLRHLRHGTDDWEIRLYTEHSHLAINKDNWDSFCYYVRSLMWYSPNSAASLIDKYPHVRV